MSINDYLAAIIRKVDGNHDLGAAALADAMVEQFDSAFVLRWRNVVDARVTDGKEVIVLVPR